VKEKKGNLIDFVLFTNLDECLFVFVAWETISILPVNVFSGSVRCVIVVVVVVVRSVISNREDDGIIAKREE
jgi:hypothetical protein